MHLDNKLFPLLLFFLIISVSGSADTAEEKRPLIGISCSHPENRSSVSTNYSESVIKAGGIPVLIPVTTDTVVLRIIVDKLDGIILTGGEDIHPSYYNEEPIEQLGNVNAVRDVYDLCLIRLAADRNMPLLGICRGEQLMNVAFGGSLYQDIPTQYPDTTVNHNQIFPSNMATHHVKLAPGSLLARITEKTELYTNTHHHQAVKDVAPPFRATAWSEDGIIEAIEAIGDAPLWGVQFHPEGQIMSGDIDMFSIFRHFIGQASLYSINRSTGID